MIRPLLFSFKYPSPHDFAFFYSYFFFFFGAWLGRVMGFFQKWHDVIPSRHTNMSSHSE